MNTRERIRIIRLLEKIKDNQAFAKAIGISATEPTIRSETSKD